MPFGWTAPDVHMNRRLTVRLPAVAMRRVGMSKSSDCSMRSLWAAFMSVCVLAGRKLQSDMRCTLFSANRLSDLRATRELMPATLTADVSPTTAKRSTKNFQLANVTLMILWLFIRWKSSITLTQDNSKANNLLRYHI